MFFGKLHGYSLTHRRIIRIVTTQQTMVILKKNSLLVLVRL
jgi:hypothetical protein